MKTRNCSEQMAEFYQRVARGNGEAIVFLLAWHEYCHEWDDLVDSFWPESDRLMAVAAHAVDLYSIPYYVRHMASLKPIAKHVTCVYGLSARWERDPEKWIRQCSDVLRHCGNDMVYAVAEIEGGWDHRVQVTEVLARSVVADRNEKD